MAVNLLMSYAFHAKTDLNMIRAKMPCGRILIDSGAFTAWSTGKEIKLNEYVDFLRNFEGVWDHAVTLDTIGDPIATAKNTRKLHGMGIPVMPVFTVGDTLAEFDSMVRDVGYVCVGGTVGMNKEHQTRRLAMLQRRAEGLGGGIHALGVGADTALRKIRPYSSDASNVSGAFRFGTVIYWDGKTLRHCSVKDTKKFAAAVPHIARHGIDVKVTFAGRTMPTGKKGRGDLMHGMSYAYAVADEVLKRERPVPVPEGINDLPGTHLYNSAMPHLAEAVADLDTEIHTGRTPAVWSDFKHIHECSPRKVR